MAMMKISEDDLEKVGGGISWGFKKKEEDQITVNHRCPHCKTDTPCIPESGNRFYCTKCEQQFTDTSIVCGEGLKETLC
ncbi:MAG: hypothetical protein K5857_03865 [Lachnospiraceae bacterium]|nr:hypothetical protein [Lachnospiraceae bacterium]